MQGRKTRFALAALAFALDACSNAPATGAAPDGDGRGPTAILPDGGGPPAAGGEAQGPERFAGARVSLPAMANRRAYVRDVKSGMALGFTLAGASHSAPVREGATVRFPGGAPGGGDWVHRPGEWGTEDFVHFATKPPVEEVRYHLDVSGAAGLRLVSHVLELLDADGTPRLRMQAPYVIDHAGRVTAATVAVEGCAVDTSPLGPWKRALVAPGSTECTVRVAWSGAPQAVLYPAVLDPTWTAATNTMTVARRSHTATLLADGRVLVVGGERTGAAGGPLTYHATAELFDPGTGTFAATGGLTVARSHHAAAALADGTVVIVGGGNLTAAIGTAELWETSTGQFRAVGPLREARRDAAMARRNTGELLISGGTDLDGDTLRSSEFYDPGTERWIGAVQMSSARTEHALIATSLGTVLAVGGISTPGVLDLTSCEELGSAGAWSRTGSLTEARHGFGTAQLSTGSLLVAGGQRLTGNVATATAETYDPATRTWTGVGDLAEPRAYGAVTPTRSGSAVASGGAVLDAAGAATTVRRTAEIFQPESNDWAPLPDLAQARYLHTGLLLDDGRILVAGGQGTTATLATAELLEQDADGEACVSSATCRSGFCADGVCCESACEGQCQACTRAATGAGNGLCTNVTTGADPRGDCTDDGAPTCGQNGSCDGAGACDRYAASGCTPSACTADVDCTSGHCADGLCCDVVCDGPCEACSAAKKGSGSDGTCGSIDSGEDPDAECPRAGTGVCAGDGACDGAGACRVPSAGTACRSAACEDAVRLAEATACANDGSCVPTVLSCSPFLCDAPAAECSTSCQNDGDCAPKAHCEGGLCEKSSDGTPCDAGDECASGSCADGVCCDTPCGEQCAACDVAGSEGTCSPLEGAPRGSREPCATDPSGTCAGECNGSLIDRCTYPGEETSCGPASGCESGGEFAELCNGSGRCARTPTTDCTPYACRDTVCRTACTEDAHCESGHVCEPDGTCLLENAARCSADSMLLPDGSSRSCAPYTCKAGACTTECATTEDCSAGAACDETTGVCLAKASKDDGGCGCRVTGREGDASRAPHLLSLLVVLGLLGRRPFNWRAFLSLTARKESQP